MTQMDVDTEVRVADAEQAEHPDEAAPGPGKFACPSCGSMLRTGAILCPHCEADLWTIAHGGPEPAPEPEPEPEPESHAAADEPLPASGSWDGRLARRALVLAAAAVGADLLFGLVASAVADLSWLWLLLGWATALMALPAVNLARRAGGRVDGGPDKRRPISARYALILGMASLAYEASTFITWAIDHAIHFHG
jgi:hypothetical protein